LLPLPAGCYKLRADRQVRTGTSWRQRVQATGDQTAEAHECGADIRLLIPPDADRHAGVDLAVGLTVLTICSRCHGSDRVGRAELFTGIENFGIMADPVLFWPARC